MVNCFYIVVRSMAVESGLPSEKELRDSGLECGSRKASSKPVEWQWSRQGPGQRPVE